MQRLSMSNCLYYLCYDVYNGLLILQWDRKSSSGGPQVLEFGLRGGSHFRQNYFLKNPVLVDAGF